jgi:hypothetical protein
LDPIHQVDHNLDEECSLSIESRITANYMIKQVCEHLDDVTGFPQLEIVAGDLYQQSLALGVKPRSGSVVSTLSDGVAHLQDGADLTNASSTTNTDFFGSTFRKYAEEDGHECVVVGCDGTAVKPLSGYSFDILTVVNPPFIFLNGEAEATFQAKLCETRYGTVPCATCKALSNCADFTSSLSADEAAVTTFLYTEEGLTMGNARFSGWIIDNLAQIAADTGFKFRLQAVNTKFDFTKQGDCFKEKVLPETFESVFTLDVTQDATIEGKECTREALSFAGWNLGTYGGGQVAVYDENVRTLLREKQATGEYNHGQEPLAIPDMYWAGFFITPERLRVSDMSSPFLDTGLKFTSKKEGSSSLASYLSTFLEPFDSELWYSGEWAPSVASAYGVVDPYNV